MSSVNSGIKLSEKLASDFKELATNKKRVLFVQISNPESEHQLLECVASKDALETSWEGDYHMISDFITVDTAAFFVIYQFAVSQYLLITFVPDNCPVKSKMLYSSTKHALLKQLGDSLFSDNLYANQLSDLTLKAYQEHVKSNASTTQPLTAKEIDMRAMKLAECGTGISISTKQSFNNGINLPLTNPALLNAFSKTSTQILFFKINGSEMFDVVSHECAGLSEIPSILLKHLPKDLPQFALFNAYKASETKTMFLYTCPLDSAVKNRMLYSASRASLISTVEAVVVVDVKSELADLADVTEKWLVEELEFHEIASETAKKESSGFIKKGVSGPGGGARRLVKSP